MSLTALVVRHVVFEDLGLLRDVLTERGYDIRYLEAGQDEITAELLVDADLVVVLGGPIGVGDAERYPFLTPEIAAIRARVERGRPTLGVCLGAQLMAAAMGAAVAPTGRVEIGFSPLTLTPDGAASVLGGLADVPVLHWHGDQFEIPVGAERLAETPGFPNQAFAAGRNLLGLQFHLEVDPRMVETWLIANAYELAIHELDPREIRADALALAPRLTAAARTVVGGWIDALDPVQAGGNKAGGNDASGN
ncbi:glutamine amidotransferase [Pseudoclavibacter sp. Z016]|uniref:glutamine amidotransferase n=1 Tax=Pseudoclavibacter sp. Z016 TaxID=2080581 RepID=UPI000CE87596|nr:glutamine amidotransferase [Pseudoclavibacter sp. Z016]PPF75611.1 glutamine amidotransferase [Pseudoclavibacter sp. Z016]